MILSYKTWLDITGTIDTVMAYMFSVGSRTGTCVAKVYESNGTNYSLKKTSNPVNLANIFDGTGTIVTPTKFSFDSPIEMDKDVLVTLSVTSSDPDDGIVLYTTEYNCATISSLVGYVGNTPTSLANMGLKADGYIFLIGTFLYDDGDTTTAIRENSIDLVKVYPNPVLNNLRIENLYDATNINIYNVMGQVVRTIPSATGSISVDMSNLSNGLYFIKMQNGKTVRTEKIQVVK